jgi:hypothetical protein
MTESARLLTAHQRDVTSAASPTVAQTGCHTATATLLRLNGAGGAGTRATVPYVADVTIPDGTNFGSANFRQDLAGAEHPNNDLDDKLLADLHQRDADQLQVALPQEVGPGQSLDISVNMTAPAEPGNYKGFWQLSNAQGTVFGVQIYVDINVAGGASAASNTTGTPGTPAPRLRRFPGPGATGSTVTQMTLSVESATVQSSCPYTFRFPASLTLNKDGKVTYRLEAGSNTAGFEFSSLPGASTTNLSAGTHTFTYELAINNSMSGWARLHVTSPDDVTSTEVTYTLTCQ